MFKSKNRGAVMLSRPLFPGFPRRIKSVDKMVVFGCDFGRKSGFTIPEEYWIEELRADLFSYDKRTERLFRHYGWSLCIEVEYVGSANIPNRNTAGRYHFVFVEAEFVPTGVTKFDLIDPIKIDGFGEVRRTIIQDVLRKRHLLSVESIFVA